MKYDLEERTAILAKMIREWIRKFPQDRQTVDDLKQLMRSSGSVGANYIEANESLSKKDFVYRIRICKKESKESIFWLKLLDPPNENLHIEKLAFIDEFQQLIRIFSKIVESCKKNDHLSFYY